MFGQKKQVKIRGKPNTQIGILSRDDFPESFFPRGYTTLANAPEVKIAVGKIADLVSSMTIHLIENTDEGDKRVRNALSRKIDVNPYKHMTRKTWVYKIVEDLLLHGDGNSVVYPIMRDGLIEDLKPLRAKSISYKETDDSYLIQYNDRLIYPDDVIHFVINPHPDYPYKGTGYRLALRDIVDNLAQATITKRGFFSGKYMPSLIVKLDSMNEDISSKEGRAALLEKFFATKNRGEPLLIPADTMEIEQIKPLSLEDIAINKSVEIDKRTIAGLLGVPAFFLGVGEFNSGEYRNFINTRVMGIAQVIAQTLTRDLLISPFMYFRFNPRSLYSYSLQELVIAGMQMVKANAMTRNEMRDWVGLDPREDMEELLVLENFLPVDQLGNQSKLNDGGEINSE